MFPLVSLLPLFLSAGWDDVTDEDSPPITLSCHIRIFRMPLLIWPYLHYMLFSSSSETKPRDDRFKDWLQILMKTGPWSLRAVTWPFGSNRSSLWTASVGTGFHLKGIHFDDFRWSLNFICCLMQVGQGSYWAEETQEMKVLLLGPQFLSLCCQWKQTLQKRSPLRLRKRWKDGKEETKDRKRSSLCHYGAQGQTSGQEMATVCVFPC